jgi:hypothetical protein
LMPRGGTVGRLAKSVLKNAFNAPVGAP